jgi:hypothetical protein
MFTGIETLGTIKEIPMKEKNNLHVTVESSITGNFK